MGGRHSLAKTILGSRLFLVLVAGILLLFAVGFFKAFWQDRQIQKEIKRLEDAKSQLETLSRQLNERLEQAESPSFVEREARLRLGLTRPGEQEIRLLEDMAKITAPSALAAAAARVKIPNHKLWWQYFFNNQLKN